ncbi:GntR family transcriptional regulator [Aquamicrobium sp. LC103]|uniref:GntR family transcriptional regulator n=1 Tax=Aquamicrobium sp. LC103 TaxID=1120658 RepID=UPI001FEEDF5C|nr:GntR family transcriptional regulator [Aquamicrobium sp. LC103]
MDQRSANDHADATSSEHVLAMLREHILAGKFAPGERLHQDRLAEMLGVSRTPLRTALATLSQTGLVRYESNRGFRVREFSIAEMKDAFRIRGELEALACRMAAASISHEDIDKLLRLVEEGDRLIACGNLQEEALTPYRQMNVDFHTTILNASGSRWVADFVHQLHSVPLASDRIIMWDSYEIIHRSHDDHHRIAKALADRDAQRAGGIMYEHIAFAGEHLINRLKSHPDEFLRVPVDAEDSEDSRRKSKSRKRKTT